MGKLIVAIHIQFSITYPYVIRNELTDLKFKNLILYCRLFCTVIA